MYSVGLECGGNVHTMEQLEDTGIGLSLEACTGFRGAGLQVPLHSRLRWLDQCMDRHMQAGDSMDTDHMLGAVMQELAELLMLRLRWPYQSIHHAGT